MQSSGSVNNQHVRAGNHRLFARFFGETLDRALDALAREGTGHLDLGVQIALRVAAYQILFLDRIPAYAAVSEAVEACKALGGRGVAGFANALVLVTAGIVLTSVQALLPVTSR